MRFPEALLAGLLLLPACTLSREYVGVELRMDPDGRIVPGTTTKEEILLWFGPPDRIERQFDGDIFVYQFQRTNSAALNIEEPVITDLQIFTWSKVQQKADRLVVLFAPSGVVKGYGFRRGTQELERF